MKKYLFITFICLSAVVLFAQDTLTIGQVFNYNIGDKMHYKTDCSPGYYKRGDRKTVLDRWISVNNDTIFYIIHNNNYVKQYDPSTGSAVTDYYIYDDTTYVTNLNNKITHLPKWDDIDIANPNLFNFQYYYGNDAQYGNVLTNGYSYELGDFEPTYIGDLWAAGLGMIREYHSEMDEDNYVSTEMKLVYYKKGNAEWGNALILGIEDTEKAAALSCVPNPATTHVKINNTHAGQLSIYTLNGQLLKQIALQPQQSIDISDLSTGAYILQWQDAISQQTQRAKLLKY